jgi:hypothetical protein
MSSSTPKPGSPCQVCGSADTSLTMCGGCADAVRRLLHKGGGPAATPPRDPRLGPCSFCSAENSDLRAMFVGPELYGDPVRLCDQCLDLCCDIVAERRLEAATGLEATAGREAAAGRGATTGREAAAGHEDAGSPPTPPPSAPPVPPPSHVLGAPTTPADDLAAEGFDPVATLVDGRLTDDTPIRQTLETDPCGTPEAPPAAPERSGRTLLHMPKPSAAGERWLTPKPTTECPACNQLRPLSSLLVSCTTCFARARAPANVVQPPEPQVLSAPAPTLPLPPAGGDFACSFCHRPRSLVRGLVSGPRVFVCESCITDFAVALEPFYWWPWERPGRSG